MEITNRTLIMSEPALILFGQRPIDDHTTAMRVSKILSKYERWKKDLYVRRDTLMKPMLQYDETDTKKERPLLCRQDGKPAYDLGARKPEWDAIWEKLQDADYDFDVRQIKASRLGSAPISPSILMALAWLIEDDLSDAED